MDALVWWAVAKGTALLVLSWFGGAVVVIGGIAFTTWQLFKWLGGKWIDERFQQRMEAFKSEQQRELERLRHRINETFDRTKRLHDKEFEHLPDIWGKLYEAFEHAATYLTPIRQYPPIDKLEEELRHVLEDREFAKGDIDAVLNSGARQEKFEFISEFKSFDQVINYNNVFALAFKKNGIFIKPEIETQMDKYFRLMRDAVNQQHLAFASQTLPRAKDKIDKFEAEGPSLLAAIREQVHARLWESTKIDI